MKALIKTVTNTLEMNADKFTSCTYVFMYDGNLTKAKKQKIAESFLRSDYVRKWVRPEHQTIDRALRTTESMLYLNKYKDVSLSGNAHTLDIHHSTGAMTGRKLEDCHVAYV